MNFILRNKNKYENLSCVVVSILPPEYNRPGDLEAKKHITRELNSKIKQACIQNDLYFFSIQEYIPKKLYQMRLKASLHCRLYQTMMRYS